MNKLSAFKAYVDISALNDPNSLGPFGLYARWLFVLGLYVTALQGNKDKSAAEFKPLMDKSFSMIDQNVMRHYRLRDVYLNNSDPIKMVGLADELSKWFNNYIKNLPQIPRDEKELFQKAVYLLRYSKHGKMIPTAADTMEKFAKMLSVKLGVAFANAFRFNVDGGDDEDSGSKVFSGKETIEAIYNSIESIVKKLTGKKGTRLDPDKIKELKLKSGDEVRDLVHYDDERKRLRTLTNNSLYVILSNGNLPAEKVWKAMQSQGFRDVPFPTEKDGYTGYVGLDKQGKLALFTPGGKQIMGLVAPGSKVTMNKKYNEEEDNTFYFMFRAPNAVSDSRGYTTSFKDIKTEAKHAKTETNTDKVATWVKTWERDLMNKDPMRNVPAAVAMILYLTSARIGTSKDTQSLKGGAHTYGISTLRKQHVRIGSASIILDYVGKKGVHQKHVIKMDNRVNKRIGTILKGLLAGKKKDDLVFAFPRPLSRTGAIQEVNPAFFRNYLKSTGVTINPHALRHIRGTALAVELMNSQEWKPSPKAKSLAAKQREAEAWMKEKVLTQVANLLGHKATKNGVVVPLWSTSIKAYINPVVVKDWFRDKQLAVPKWVPQKLED
ncbi:putative topoisomerase I protein [Rhizobium phage RHph_N28_1]|nr:putative topoisomerase I protein [Rhizobium phage RHph_N28_1]QIG74300.1 putative topoisomerase I protein [Rhizobium phage RHph_N42]QXV73959.1 putative topoisomerase I protein [Rhizobium phage RHph_N46]